MSQESQTPDELRADLALANRAYDWAQDELNRLVSELESIADDKDGECQYSYAPGVVDSLLVKLGYRKHWEDRKPK